MFRRTSRSSASHPGSRPLIERLDSRCLLSATSTASIAGLWSGSRTEAGLSGAFATVTIDLNLTQKGAAVSGTERRSSPQDSEYFADMLTGGTVTANVFHLQDRSITASRRPSNYKWLLYGATLTLSADGQTLSGGWSASGVHGSMTLQRIPLPRITLASAGPAKASVGGITLRYVIATAAVTHALRFDVYRSSTPRLNATSQLIGTQILSPHSHAKLLTVGTHHLQLLTGTSLSGDKKRPYVIIVVNADSAIVEAPDSLNSLVFLLQSF